MGDLECGFEEMEGVRLGYLLIKGKQMFALSQVFTDLLKNIPRTTVHKRMDHLNVKKHHCDLEELRKLKAINSIAFHAAKCTLISREDVEALYVSCKKERVLKSTRRKIKTNSRQYVYDGQVSSDSQNRFWEEKVWLSLHGVPQPLPFKNRSARQLELSSQATNLSQIYNKLTRHCNTTVAKSACRLSKNYETGEISGDCLPFNQSHSFFRSMVCSRQPIVYQSAIAVQSRLSSNPDLTHKRKRLHENAGWHFWNTSRHSRVFLIPKCCNSKVSNSSLNRFNLEQDLCIDRQHIVNFLENCSSDTESSSYSEHADNDSDFGSSLSATSNTTSDDEEDDSLSESSDVSSEEDSSSQSDSSSVSSQVSLQSIRFRRISFSAFNNKAPLLTQPTFQYDLRHRTHSQTEAPLLDYKICNRKLQKCDLKLCVKKQEETGVSRQSKSFPLVLRNCYPESKREINSEVLLSHFEIPRDPKRTEPTIKERSPSPCLEENKNFPKQWGQANKCLQALISNCDSDKETMVSQPPDKNPSLGVNLKNELNISYWQELPLQVCPIKTETADQSTLSTYHSENAITAKTPASLLHNVKIKIEENFEYQYSCQIPGYELKYQDNDKEPDITNALYLNDEAKPVNNQTNTNKTTEDTENPATSQKPPQRREECKSTLSTGCPEEGEYKNGARVRKNYRSLVLGKQSRIQRAPLKLNVKADRTACSSGKPYDGSSGDVSSVNKRKRTASNVAAVKKPFDFMANFPSPPSLIIGSDGDLSPAYSLKCSNSEQSPYRSHPVWKWQLGGSAVPLPPSHMFRKF